MSDIRRKFEAARDRAKALAAQATRTEAEEQELVDQLDRAESLKGDLEEIDAREARLDALSEVSRSIPVPGQLVTLSTPDDLTAGEYLFATRDLMLGNIGTDEYLDRAGKYHDRATGVSADVAGILPKPIVGPLINLFDDRRRVWNSFTPRPMPAGGRKFDRPRVTQHVAVGEQAAEGDTLASQKFTVTADEVTKRTFGGTLELTRQQIDWSDPSALQLVVTDFAQVYARFTEMAAVTHLTGLATAASPWADGDHRAIVESFTTAIMALTATLDDDLPLTIWLDTVSASKLALPTSSANDRTIMSVLREALDALDPQISFVTSRRLPADTRIIGAGGLVESYEDLHGLLTMAMPSSLKTELSYSGYAAFHGIADGFIKLEA